MPMFLQIDNKGAKDLTCNWSAGGRVRHVDIQQYFLRDLKEDGIIKTQWIPTLENSADLFTKNLYGPLFEKHTYVGIDMYMEREDKNETDEWTFVHKTGNRKLKPRFDRNIARGESVGNVRQGLGLRARHPNCPWNGQLESLDRYLESSVVGGIGVQRQPSTS
jgi:hypothetical protein